MMKTLLDEIIALKYQEVARLKQQTSIAQFARQPLFSQPVISLKRALLEQEFGIIAEIKRKSPSGGNILPGLDPAELAISYANNGAAGISVLTDFPYFGGSIRDLEHVRQVTGLPILRKEFIIDEIQLFEAKAMGADAILLIAGVLEKKQAHHLTIVAQNLGLEVVFEIHTIHELDQLNDEVDLIAVNNRDLATQQTSLEHCFGLAAFLPDFAPAIAASGIRTAEEIQQVQQAGYCGALIGESILRNGHLSGLTRQTQLRP